MNISNPYFFILTLVVLNFISSVYFIRFDITEEKNIHLAMKLLI